MKSIASAKKMVCINGRFLSQEITGVQRVCREFVAALDALLHEGFYPDLEFEILVPPAVSVEKESFTNIKVRQVGHGGGHFWEQAYLGSAAGGKLLINLGNTCPVSRLFRKDDFDLVMVHDLSFKYFPTAYSWKFKAVYSALMPLIMKRASAVCTVSLSEKLAIEREYKDIQNLTKRLFYAANGPASIGMSQVLQRDEVNREDFGIYVGSLTKRKNAHGILEAVVRLSRENGQRFLFVGASSTSFTGVGLEVPSDVSEHVQFFGHADDKTLAELYQRASFLLFPSYYEASPLPVTEAMTFGCPVVASNIPSLIERCGDAAIYCDPGNVDSILEAVRFLKSAEDVRTDIVNKGYAQVAKFSWRHQAQIIIDRVNEILK